MSPARTHTKYTAAAALALALAFAASCTGQVDRDGSKPGGPGAGNGGPGGPGGNGNGGNGNGGNGNGGGPGPGPGPGGMTVQPGQEVPGVAVFHRLTRLEYDNTLRDLLGDTSAPGKGFAGDQESAKSGFFGGGAIANADANHLLEATEAVAANAVKRLTELLPCKALPAAQGEQDQCAKDFIAQFGKRAFRRPLTGDESGELVAFYNEQRMAGSDFPNAMRLVISAFLMSPQFLYRWEVAPRGAIKDGNFVRYSGWEIASRLSYMFWASMPDDALFALAEQNKLTTTAQIEAEARRMLKDAKARDMIADFVQQWLGITDLASVPKDPKVYPSYSPALVSSLLAETSAFAAAQILDGDGTMNALFTSNKSFLDTNLAGLYGGTGGATLAPAELNAAQRGGILTQGSFLAGHASSDESNPTRRGKVMAERVTCVEIALPPDDVPDPKPPAPNLSVRERFEEHSKQPCATACHGIMDPLGFAFENYNGVGGYQTMDGGKPVNASGVLKIDGQERPFKNAIEMSRLLGDSKQVGECLARQFLRYALKRKEQVGDEAGIASALAAFSSKGYDLRELMVSLTKTKAFTHRYPSTGEVLP
jgi:hypothetical protein